MCDTGKCGGIGQTITFAMWQFPLIHKGPKGVIMTSLTTQEYRVNARQCLAWGEQAKDSESREAFFALAKTWDAAARRLEESPVKREGRFAAHAGFPGHT